MTAVIEDAGVMETQIIDMKIKIEGEVEVKVEGSITKIEVEVKKTFQLADVGHGRIMIPITVIGTTGIDPVKARTIVIEVGDGTATGDKMMVTEAEVDDGTNTINIPHKNILKTIRRLIITGPHQWDVSTNTKCRMNNTHPTRNSNNMPNGSPHNQDKLQIYVNYVKTRAYDYQCQFAGDFMARTQKAFNQGCSYNHQDPTQGEWSTGENDNDDPNGQPFQ